MNHKLVFRNFNLLLINVCLEIWFFAVAFALSWTNVSYFKTGHSGGLFSLMNMESHVFFACFSKKGFSVRSFGTGANVKLPGSAPDRPNIYPFDVTYDEIYRDLVKKDPQLYPIHYTVLYIKFTLPVVLWANVRFSWGYGTVTQVISKCGSSVVLYVTCHDAK